MVIYSHWVSYPNGGLKRVFFGRKTEQEAAAKEAKSAGCQILAEGEYQIEPKAQALAAKLNELQATTDYDLAEEFVRVERARVEERVAKAAREQQIKELLS